MCTLVAEWQFIFQLLSPVKQLSYLRLTMIREEFFLSSKIISGFRISFSFLSGVGTELIFKSIRWSHGMISDYDDTVGDARQNYLTCFPRLLVQQWKVGNLKGFNTKFQTVTLSSWKNNKIVWEDRSSIRKPRTEVYLSRRFWLICSGTAETTFGYPWHWFSEIIYSSIKVAQKKSIEWGHIFTMTVLFWW